MDAAVLAVEDRRPPVAIRLQSRPSRLLGLVEDGIDLLVGRPVGRSPRDHDRRVLPRYLGLAKSPPVGFMDIAEGSDVPSLWTTEAMDDNWESSKRLER